MDQGRKGSEKWVFRWAGGRGKKGRGKKGDYNRRKAKSEGQSQRTKSADISGNSKKSWELDDHYCQKKLKNY